MLRSILSLVASILVVSLLSAQGKGKTELTVAAGFLPVSQDEESLGLLFNLESKVKIEERLYLGVRFGVAVNTHDFENLRPFEFFINEQHDHGILSLVPVCDYYFPTESRRRPFVGLGLGYHLSPAPVEIFEYATDTVLGVSLKSRIGLLIRGGLETGRFRAGLEYNLLPRADLTFSDGRTLGSVGNSFVGLTAGLIIGGGAGQ